MVEIETVPCLSDNYAYLVRVDGQCAVIDPSEAAPVRAALAKRGDRLDFILNTHHHLDHCGGNLELKQEFGAKVVGAAKDAARLPGLDIGVDEHTAWAFGGLQVQVLEVPGHTLGAITYVIDGKAFTGDTLFLMGCGRMFEGDAAMMWASLSKLMTLPDTTQLYCGHEYTRNNGRFALTLEPGNDALQARMRELETSSPITVPATLALEKKTNPFLRPDSNEIRKHLELEKADTVTVFAAIRARKDNF